MTTGMSLELQHGPTPPHDDPLHNFAEWLDLNPPPLSMVVGMLDLLGNELYRHNHIREGSEIKHIVHVLRGLHEC